MGEHDHRVRPGRGVERGVAHRDRRERGEVDRADLLEETISFTDFVLAVDAFGQRADTLGVPVEVGAHEDPDVPFYLLHDFELTWEVTEPGPFSFQFTNDAPHQVILIGVTLEQESLVPEVPPVGMDEETGKCGCAQGPAAWTAGLPLLLLAIGSRTRR